MNHTETITPAFRALAIAALSLLPLLSASGAFAGDENSFLTPAYLKRVGNDIIELPQKPLHWERKDWLIAGGIVAATGLAFTQDDNIRTYYNSHRSGFQDTLSDLTTHFGDYKFQAPIIAGAWLSGLVTDDPTLKKIAADGAEASLIAAGMITPALVYVSGRALPDANEDAYRFRPFTPMRYSFPSGHTTEAFAMATVLDQNLRAKWGYWQTPVLYAIATGTAASRIYDYTHYLSDVVLGAGIGWAVGYWISNKPRNQVMGDVMVLPYGNGMMLALRY